MVVRLLLFFFSVWLDLVRVAEKVPLFSPSRSTATAQKAHKHSLDTKLTSPEGFMGELSLDDAKKEKISRSGAQRASPRATRLRVCLLFMVARTN